MLLIQFGSHYDRCMFLKKFDFRFVMKGSCLVGFIQKKAKPHNSPAPSLIFHLILSSLVDSSHTCHCLFRKKTLRRQHNTQMFQGVCVCVLSSESYCSAAEPELLAVM